MYEKRKNTALIPSPIYVRPKNLKLLKCIETFELTAEVAAIFAPILACTFKFRPF